MGRCRPPRPVGAARRKVRRGRAGDHRNPLARRAISELERGRHLRTPAVRSPPRAGTRSRDRGARASLAHTQTEYAEMLLARGEPSGADEAGILLDQALATYRDLGMDSHFMTAVPLRERATVRSA